MTSTLTLQDRLDQIPDHLADEWEHEISPLLPFEFAEAQTLERWLTTGQPSLTELTLWQLEEFARKSSFEGWLHRFVTEKQLDMNQLFEIRLGADVHLIEAGAVLTGMLHTVAAEQAQIKSILVRIDFVNGDPMHFFRHMAEALIVK